MTYLGNSVEPMADKYPRFYIDDEGVQRGYYVYLHKNKKTGEVFYVGKGHEKRAWDSAKRNWAWKEYVANNGCEVEVEIIENDYSENEAYDLERELVSKHGGNKYDGGTLTNLHPGGRQGEFPVVWN